MEYTEAIRYLKILKHFTDNDSAGELHKQTYDVAIKACEKQIQKKPSYYGDEDDGKILCPYCGQAINWEGVKEE